MGKGGKTVIVCQTNLTDEQLEMKDFLDEMDLQVRKENVEFQRQQQEEAEKLGLVEPEKQPTSMEDAAANVLKFNGPNKFTEIEKMKQR